MYKFGTVKELKAVNIAVPEKVYQEAMSIATILAQSVMLKMMKEDLSSLL